MHQDKYLPEQDERGRVIKFIVEIGLFDISYSFGVGCAPLLVQLLRFYYILYREFVSPSQVKIKKGGRVREIYSPAEEGLCYEITALRIL